MAKKKRVLGKTKGVRVELVSLDLSIVVRASRLDPKRVEQYVEAMRGGDKFPPVLVFRDPKTGRLWLVDGHHRVEAARLRELDQIDAIIMDGDWREAFLHALTLGRELRRTNADKQHCVEIMLEDPEWVDLSDAQIARHTEVTPKTVHAARERLGLVTTVRRTADGRTMDVSRIGSAPRGSETAEPANSATDKSATHEGASMRTSTQEFPECSSAVPERGAAATPADIAFDLRLDGTAIEVGVEGRAVSWRVASRDKGRARVEGRFVVHGRPVATRRGDITTTVRDGSHVRAAVRKLGGE